MSLVATRTLLVRWRIERVVAFKYDVMLVEERHQVPVTAETCLDVRVQQLCNVLGLCVDDYVLVAVDERLFQHVARQIVFRAVDF